MLVIFSKKQLFLSSNINIVSFLSFVPLMVTNLNFLEHFQISPHIIYLYCCFYLCLSKERNRNGGNRIRKSPKAEIMRETCLWLHVISCDVSKLFALNYVFLLVSPVLDCDDSLFVFCCFVSSTSNIHHGAVLPWEAFQTLKSNEHIDYHLLNFRACFMTFTIYSSSAKTIEVSELKSTLRDSSHLSASSRRAEVKIRCNNTHIS